MKAPLLLSLAGSVLAGLATVGFASRSGQGTSAEKASLGGDVLYVMPPIVHRNLALYPIRLSPRTTDNYLTLDEGLKTGVVEVREMGSNPPPLIRNRPPNERIPAHARTETNVQTQQTEQRLQQSAGGEVNRLLIINRSDRKLLLIAGEMVVGGKQDRIVQKDSIVPPSDKPKVIEVFCVEHGRWSGADAQFSAAALPPAGGGAGGLGGGIADPSVRGAAQAKTEQQAVWDEVGKKNAKLGAAPGQSTYQAARVSATNVAEQKPYLNDFEHKVLGKDVVGVVVAINGKLVWMDAFSSSPLFSKYWPKLLQSYILEAISTGPPKDLEQRIRWRLPTTKEAAAYLEDRSGSAKFEGEEDVYKLLRIDGRTHVIYELSDIDRKSPHRVHTCKMEKK